MGTIVINEIEWKIIEVDNLPEDVLGTTSNVDYTIRIRNDLSEQSKGITLKHEMVHAYLYSYGFKEKDTFTVEELCEFIAFNIDNLYGMNELVKRSIEE